MIAYDPLRASSYIPLPQELKYKNCFVNVKNTFDHGCFLWSILAHLYDFPSNRNRVQKYQYLDYVKDFNLDMSNISFPTPIDQLDRFERRNPTLAINVFGWDEEEKKIYYRRPTKSLGECQINLLLISNNEQSHYVLITNVSAMLTRQLSHHNGKKHFCFYCMHAFESEDTLNRHSKLCQTHQPQHAKMPNKDDNVLRFTKTEYQLPCPFVIYCDFESLLVPTSTADDYIPTRDHPGVEQQEDDEEDSERLKTSWTNKYQEHRACSFAYHIVSTDKRYYSDPKLYFGENAAEIFLDMLMREEKILRKWLSRIPPMNPLTREERTYFYSRNPKCHICNEPIMFGRKVKDHSHLDGTYNGMYC